MAQKSVLGKGLASLLPGASSSTPDPAVIVAGPPPEENKKTDSAGTPTIANKDRHPGISLATIDDIRVNPYQPRRKFNEQHISELSQSIKENGVIQPLIVRKGERGYELIAGERRLRAAKKAGLKSVPIVIRKSTDRESLELALIENIQRQDLNCVDEALGYQQLMDEFKLTQEEIAKQVGKERATVANHLRLLKLPQEILDDLKINKLTLGHAKALLGIESRQLQLEVRKEVLEKNLSVRNTESFIQELKAQSKADLKSGETAEEKTKKVSKAAERLNSISQDLTRQWLTRVEVKGSERRGKIIVHYATRQDLDRILDQMNP